MNRRRATPLLLVGKKKVPHVGCRKARHFVARVYDRHEIWDHIGLRAGVHREDAAQERRHSRERPRRTSSRSQPVIRHTVFPLDRALEREGRLDDG